ncbi:Rid family hydrolase [Paracoccaceae bacterium]|nr:Rid family hydrolase [Paracoccaceae bacterium]
MTALRSSVPFGKMWGMRLDHPYSSLVTEGDYAWTSGQCPLDTSGNVLYANDLVAQAKLVVDYIHVNLEDASFNPSSVVKLVVYYTQTDTDQVLAMLQVFEQSFADNVLVVPIAVPAFYYEGMMIEVDVYAAKNHQPVTTFTDPESGLSLQLINSMDLTWATLTTDIQNTQALCLESIEHLLAKANLSTEHLLCDQWYQSEEISKAFIKTLTKSNFCQNPNSVFNTNAYGHKATLAELTFVTSANDHSRTIAPTNDTTNLSLTGRYIGNYFSITANIDDETGLVDQTRTIMTNIASVLEEWGLTFEDVCKATTTYVGDSSAEDLHDNMAIRNSYYSKPGPASTGLRINHFINSQGKISVTLFGLV